MLESRTKQACLNSTSYISNKTRNYCNMFRHSHLYSLIHSIIKSYFTSRRSKFGYIHPTAFVRLPTIIKGAENVYMYERTHILSNSVILTTNAKFILKKNSGAAEGLTVVTGNHYSVVGKFFMDITDADKPKDMDPRYNGSGRCVDGYKCNSVNGCSYRSRSGNRSRERDSL